MSPGKIDKYEYITGEKILPPDQRRLIEQAKFTYSPQIKTILDQEIKQVETLKALNS